MSVRVAGVPTLVCLLRRKKNGKQQNLILCVTYRSTKRLKVAGPATGSVSIFYSGSVGVSSEGSPVGRTPAQKEAGRPGATYRPRARCTPASQPCWTAETGFRVKLWLLGWLSSEILRKSSRYLFEVKG